MLLRIRCTTRVDTVKEYSTAWERGERKVARQPIIKPRHGKTVARKSSLSLSSRFECGPFRLPNNVGKLGAKRRDPEMQGLPPLGMLGGEVEMKESVNLGDLRVPLE